MSNTGMTAAILGCLLIIAIASIPMILFVIGSVQWYHNPHAGPPVLFWVGSGLLLLGAIGSIGRKKE